MEIKKVLLSLLILAFIILFDLFAAGMRQRRSNLFNVSFGICTNGGWACCGMQGLGLFKTYTIHAIWWLRVYVLSG